MLLIAYPPLSLRDQNAPSQKLYEMRAVRPAPIVCVRLQHGAPGRHRLTTLSHVVSTLAAMSRGSSQNMSAHTHQQSQHAEM